MRTAGPRRQNRWPSRSASPAGQARFPIFFTISAPVSSAVASPSVACSLIFSQEQGWAVRAGDPRRSFFATGTGEPTRDWPWPEPTGRPVRLPEPASSQPWNEPSDFSAPLIGEREGLKLLESLGRELAG